ncbi:MAG: hypothetical protein Q8L86_18235 [Vicinamibacterales bacterium]|nr:hypothetical protein [Vicinamibacterales bacterium]
MTDDSADRARRIVAMERAFEQLKKKRARLLFEPETRLAVRASRELLVAAEELRAYDSGGRRLRNVHYARYLLATSECIHAELHGRFDDATQHLLVAIEMAHLLDNSPRFFPNYWTDRVELESHALYQDAVLAFKNGRFAKAALDFDRWLTANSHLARNGLTRYDSNYFHKYLCLAIDAFEQRRECSAPLSAAADVLADPQLSIHRLSRALWNHIEPLRALAGGALWSEPHASELSATLLDRAREEWRLLLQGARLKRRDRGASLAEPVRLPLFLDFSQELNIEDDYWRFVLLQALRNALMLKADYESKLHPRLKRRSDDGTVVLKSCEIEHLEVDAAIAYIKKLVKARQAIDFEIMERVLPSWFDARDAALSGDFGFAMRAYVAFFSQLRSLPHVVRVNASFRTSGEVDSAWRDARPSYQFTAERVWQCVPRTLVGTTSSTPPSIGYAYMRPRWNKNLKAQAHIRNPMLDSPMSARMPEWMALFERWVKGHGPVDANRFARWCSQMPARWLPVALRLLTQVIFVDEPTTRKLWRTLFTEQVPDLLRTRSVTFVGLGEAGKSGPAQMYWLKQALSELPPAKSTINVRAAFRSEASLGQLEDTIELVVFVDDFVGSGSQAKAFLGSLVTKYPKLKTRLLFLAALAGFDTGVEEVKRGVPGSVIVPLIGRVLNDSHRAFSPANSLWDCDNDRLIAREWCENVGKQLVSSMGLDQKHALGWEGSQAMIAFHYNVPNNTLPLFWGSGQVDGRRWESLFDRF